MHAVDALAQEALRTHKSVDSLSPALRAPLAWPAPASASPAKSAAARAAAKSAAESTAARISLRAGARLSWDACVSKCALCVRAILAAATGWAKTTHLILCLAHRNGSDHLNCIRRGGLPKLSAGLGGAGLSFFRSVGVILVLSIQTQLLKPAPPATLLACIAASRPSAWGSAWCSVICGSRILILGRRRSSGRSRCRRRRAGRRG